MRKLQILAVVRHTLTFLGGILVVKGTIDESTVNEIAGSLVTLTGLIWSIADKKPKKDGSKG
jgi:hypothetical protein